MQKTTLLTTAAVALAIASTARAEAPFSKAAGYGQIGGARDSVMLAMASTATTTVYTPQTSSDIPICFPHRQAYVLHSLTADNVLCAWTESATVTFQTVATSTYGCYLDDSMGPDGRGSCFAIPGNGRADQTPWPDHSAIGSRGGVCDTAIRGFGGATVYVPCYGDDTVCSDQAAGSACDTDVGAIDRLHRENQGCSFLVCHADGASALLHIGVEQ